MHYGKFKPTKLKPTQQLVQLKVLLSSPASTPHKLLQSCDRVILCFACSAAREPASGVQVKRSGGETGRLWPRHRGRGRPAGMVR